MLDMRVFKQLVADIYISSDQFLSLQPLQREAKRASDWYEIEICTFFVY